MPPWTDNCPKCTVKSPSLFEINHPLMENLPHPKVPSCGPCFCDGCTHWTRSAERVSMSKGVFVWSLHYPDGQEPCSKTTCSRSSGNLTVNIHLSRLTGNKGFLRKAKGVYQPHLMSKTREKMSTGVEKPLQLWQKPTSISRGNLNPSPGSRHNTLRATAALRPLSWKTSARILMLPRV